MRMIILYLYFEVFKDQQDLINQLECSKGVQIAIGDATL